MSHTIAVVEDDDLIREMIKSNLKKHGYRVKAFSSSEDMIEQSKERAYDAIVLDILLPGVPGDQLLKALRSRGDLTPVLMLTVKSDIPTRIQALDTGADDYMVKPFNMEELLARVNALIRRSQQKRRIPSGGVLFINGHRVHISTRECESNIGDVVLSEKEINLLLFLYAHPGESLARADILEEVWGMDVVPTPRTIDNFILKFRKLFEDNPEHPKHFVSVRNKGYRFID